MALVSIGFRFVGAVLRSWYCLERPPITTIGKSNGEILGLIADRRITRSELNKRVKEGEFKDIHRELIAWALKGAGL